MSHFWRYGEGENACAEAIQKIETVHLKIKLLYTILCIEYNYLNYILQITFTLLIRK